MNKKIMTLFVLMLFAFSIIPAGLAEEADETIPKPVLYQAETRLKEVVSGSESVEDCIKRVNDKFPNIGEERVKAACSTSINVRENPEIRKEIREKIENNVKDSLKEKIELRVNKDMNLEQRYRIKKALENSPELEKRFDNLTSEEIKKISLLKNQNLREMSKEDISKELSKYRVKTIKKEELFQKRVVAQKDYEKAKNRYELASNRYDIAKEDFEEAKLKFEEAIANNENGTIEAKNYLNKALDMIESSLEKVKEHVSSNDDLTQTEVDETISDIDEKLVRVSELRSNLDAAKSKEEIKSLAKEITNDWVKIKARISYGATKALDSKVGEIFTRSEQLQIKLERVLATLEDKGQNTAELEVLVSEFSEKIESAKINYQKGNELIKQAHQELKANSTNKEFNEKISQGKELIKQAHEELKSAHELVKNIVKTAKEFDENISFEDNEKTVEIVEEIKDNSEIETEEEDTETKDNEAEEIESEDTESEKSDEVELETEAQEETEEDTETKDNESEEIESEDTESEKSDEVELETEAQEEAEENESEEDTEAEIQLVNSTTQE